jgi:hypothetical protein
MRNVGSGVAGEANGAGFNSSLSNFFSSVVSNQRKIHQQMRNEERQKDFKTKCFE